MRKGEFKQETIIALYKRAGEQCSLCKNLTSKPHSDPVKYHNLGEAAHINGLREGKNLRYDPLLSVEELKSIQNAIWLCSRCHHIIDNDSERFTVDALKEIKSNHEDYISRRLEAKAEGKVEKYESYLNYLKIRVELFLRQTVTDLLTLQAKPKSLSAEPFNMFDQLFIGHGIEQNDDKPENFENFQTSFEYYNRRLLLLGEPGAGKTTTLLNFALKAVNDRLSDCNQPLPIVGFLSTWTAFRSDPFAKWLAEGYPQISEGELTDIIDRGEALLLLDGFDEIPFVIEDGKSMQEAFIEKIPSSCQLLVTCRAKHFMTSDKLSKTINGAVVLKPLSIDQIFLFFPKAFALRKIISMDDEFRNILSTPLMLKMFASIYDDVDEIDKSDFLDYSKSPNEWRDFIILKYIQSVYKWELNRKNRKSEEIRFTLDQVLELLGRLATENAGSYRKKTTNRTMDVFGFDRGTWIEKNRVILEDFDLVFQNDKRRIHDFINLMIEMHLLVKQEEDIYSFAHLLIRDSLAFGFALKHLTDEALYSRLEEVSNPAEALGRTGRTRATEPLAKLLFDENISYKIRSCAALSMGYTRDPKAVDYLLLVIKVQSFYRAAEALGRIGGSLAFETLIDLLKTGSKYMRRSAVHGLGFLGDPNAIPYLQNFLEELEFADDAFTEEAIKGVLLHLESKSQVTP